MLDLLKMVRRRRADHAMYDAVAAQKLLEGLPAAPGKALEEIATWLDTVAAAEGYEPQDRLAVVKLLDETGRASEPSVLSSFLKDAALKEYDRIQLWHALAGFWEHLGAAYRLCLSEFAPPSAPAGPPNPERVLLLVRALRALANEAKILHLRYLPVTPHLWRALSELYALSEKERCATQPIKAYAADTLPTSARQEFLRELMLDANLPESELPDDIEIASRVIARLGGGFELQAQPGERCNLRFDLAQPGRPAHVAPGAPASPAASARYFGPGRVQDAIREIISRHSAHLDEPEKRFGDDYAIEEKLVVLKHLLLHWGDSPPTRHGPRVKLDAKVKVAHGFAAASELVTRIEFSGMAEMTDDQRLKVKQQTGIALEARESTAAITEWVERDASTWGVGVDIPRLDEPWARIGALCVLQAGGQKSWWIGVIRRLYRDPQNRAHAGIEIMSKKPLSVYLRGIGEGAQRAENWQTSSGSFQFTYVNALIPGESATSAARQELLIARERFSPGIQYEAMIGGKAPHVRLEELLERGEDYDRVRVTWLRAAG